MLEKVLLVDDEVEVIEGIKLALRKEPFAIIGARSTEEARVILAREPIGVLVVDENMPGEKGSDFLAVLAREFPHLPKIMLTGHANLDLAIRSINEGQIFKLLQKPCQAEELAETIKAALRRHAVSSVTDRIVNLSRRQAVLVEELDRETAAAGTPPVGGVVGTQEMPVMQSEGGDMTDADPVTMLSAAESASLSRREKEILRAVVAGKKPRDLARTFFISVHTARNHIKAIYRKLGVHSQGELIAKVLRAPGRDRFRTAS